MKKAAVFPSIQPSGDRSPGTADRRGVIRGFALTLAAMTVPAPLLAARTQPVLFVFDSRMPAALAEARAYRARGVLALDRMATDLGHAWRGQIADLLQDGAGPIAGLTLWMDSYICESFGRDFGLTMQRESAGTEGPWQRWQLQ